MNHVIDGILAYTFTILSVNMYPLDELWFNKNYLRSVSPSIFTDLSHFVYRPHF